MPLDQMFKEFIKAFLKDLMELFYPHIAERINLDQPEFLDKEVFTDIPEGSRRELDVLVKVFTIEGEPELILFHYEVQAQRNNEFPYRMYEYYALLRLRTKLPVFPIVIYLTPGTGGLHEEVYLESLFEKKILDFRYEAIGLPDLLAEEYLEHPNPVAPALSALMKAERLSRVLRKVLSLKRVLLSDLDEARKSLLVNIIESYLPLNSADEVEFNRVIVETGSEEVREMMTIYEERGIEKGLSQGKREMLLHQLRLKFGDVPETVVQKIEHVEDPEQLDELSGRLLFANSLEEMDLESI